MVPNDHTHGICVATGVRLARCIPQDRRTLPRTCKVVGQVERGTGLQGCPSADIRALGGNGKEGTVQANSGRGCCRQDRLEVQISVKTDSSPER
eukprot:UN02654